MDFVVDAYIADGSGWTNTSYTLLIVEIKGVEPLYFHALVDKTFRGKY